MEQAKILEFQRNIELALMSMKNQLNQILYDQSFESTAKLYKQVCKKLIYFTSCLSTGLLKSQKFKENLKDCSKIVKAILKSTQYEFRGHFFPLMSSLLNKIQKLASMKSQTSCPQATLQRVEKNESSRYYQSMQLSKIIKQQMDFLKLRNPNNFFLMLHNRQIYLQNSECVCCSQVLFKDWKIENYNPLIPTVFNFQYKNTIDIVLLQRCINAICNIGGGVILIGAQKKQNFLRVVGLNADNLNEISQRQNQIKKALSSSRPLYYYHIERVVVQNNLLTSYDEPENQSRVCIRILIYPYSLRQTYYLEHEVKGHNSFYEVYQLDECQKPLKIDLSTDQQLKQSKNLYSFIHQKYKLKQQKRGKNSHENIKCFKPKPLKEIDMKAKPIQWSQTQQLKDEQIFQDDPKFKYPRTCLLRTTTKKNDRWILDFETYLKSKKKEVDLVKPFEQSFREGVKSIWMMTYSKKFGQLKQILAQLEREQKILPGVIRMMPVSNTFSLERDKFSKYHENQFHKKFTNRYSELYLKEVVSSADKETKDLIYFTFNDFSQAIFAYMVLEQMQIRPYFQISSLGKKVKSTSWKY